MMNTQIQNQQPNALLRLKAVLPRVGLSKSKFYDLIGEGKAPAPCKMGRISLWRSEDIDAFISNLGNGGAV